MSYVIVVDEFDERITTATAMNPCNDAIIDSPTVLRTLPSPVAQWSITCRLFFIPTLPFTPLARNKITKQQPLGAQSHVTWLFQYNVNENHHIISGILTGTFISIFRTLVKFFFGKVWNVDSKISRKYICYFLSRYSHATEIKCHEMQSRNLALLFKIQC